MSNLLRTIALFNIFSCASLYAAECELRLGEVSSSDYSWADRQGRVSDFVHVTVEDALWTRTIFGKEAVDTNFRGYGQTEWGITTVMKGKQLDVYWAGRKIQYFDFAAEKAEQKLANDGYTTLVTLPGSGQLKLVFIYTPGLRRRLEIWAIGTSGGLVDKKILTAQSGLEFVH